MGELCLSVVERVEDAAGRGCSGDDQEIRRLARPLLTPRARQDLPVVLGHAFIDDPGSNAARIAASPAWRTAREAASVASATPALSSPVVITEIAAAARAPA